MTTAYDLPIDLSTKSQHHHHHHPHHHHHHHAHHLAHHLGHHHHHHHGPALLVHEQLQQLQYEYLASQQQLSALNRLYTASQQQQQQHHFSTTSGHHPYHHHLQHHHHQLQLQTAVFNAEQQQLQASLLSHHQSNQLHLQQQQQQQHQQQQQQNQNLNESKASASQQNDTNQHPPAHKGGPTSVQQADSPPAHLHHLHPSQNLHLQQQPHHHHHQHHHPHLSHHLNLVEHRKLDEPLCLRQLSTSGSGSESGSSSSSSGSSSGGNGDDRNENPSPIDLHRSATSSTVSTMSSPSSSSASITSTSSSSVNLQLSDKKRINRPLTEKVRADLVEIVKPTVGRLKVAINMDKIKQMTPSLTAIPQAAQLRKVLNTMFPSSYIELYHRPPYSVCSIFRTKPASDSGDELDTQPLHLEASSEPTGRAQVISLQRQLQASLAEHQAKPVGLCPKRRAIYDQCLDELIRQITVGCIEQGLLLFQLRNELRLTISYYRRAYESAVSYGLRKALRAKLELGANRAKIDQLEQLLKRQDEAALGTEAAGGVEVAPSLGGDEIDQVARMKGYYESELAKRNGIIEQQREMIRLLTSKK